MLDRLARFVYARRRLVGIAAGLFFVLAVAVGGSVAKHLDPYGNDDPATESVRTDNLIQSKGFRDTSVVVLFKGGPVTSRIQKAKIAAITKELEARKDVAAVHGFFDTRSRAFVSRNGNETYLAVALRPTDDRALQDAAQSIADSLANHPGVTVGGYSLAQKQVNQQTEQDLRTAELLVFPILFILSLLFFRSAVAAVLPLMVGGLAIVGTFLILRIAAEVGSISIFALNLTTGLGLGLAIDYSLFIVSRYREELARRGVDSAHAPAGRTERWEALRATMRTAGRTVLFSSLTVAAALASLIVFPQRFLYSMGIGGACVALFAAAVSLVVLPAVLSLLGPRVNAGAPRFLARRADRDARSLQSGFWYRLSQFVMRRPVAIALTSATVLIALGIPFLSIKFTGVDAQILPESASARQVDDALTADFPPFRTSPIRVVVDGGGSSAVADVTASFAEPRASPPLAGRYRSAGASASSMRSRDTRSSTRRARTPSGPSARFPSRRARRWQSPGSAPTTSTSSRALARTCRSRSPSWLSRRSSSSSP